MLGTQGHEQLLGFGRSAPLSGVRALCLTHQLILDGYRRRRASMSRTAGPERRLRARRLGGTSGSRAPAMT